MPLGDTDILTVHRRTNPKKRPNRLATLVPFPAVTLGGPDLAKASC